VRSMSCKFLVKGILILLFAIIGSYVIYNLPVDVEYKLKNIDLNKYKNVMIVAHPDDEMIWGGAHLIEDDYLVVCITCGNKKTRLKEFKKVMEETGDSYITLGYPDKTDGEINDWNKFYKDIYKDVEIILGSNDWNLIVTHNSVGEYGHIQHVKTNNIVTDIYDEKFFSSKLYFFGKYYSKKNIVKVEDSLISISDKLLDRKKEILELYESQFLVVENLKHMQKFEMWEEYRSE